MSDKTSKEKEQEIIDLFNQNGNISKTAKTTGIHRGTVKRILTEAGLSIEKIKFTKLSNLPKDKYCYKCKETKSIFKFKKYIDENNNTYFNDKCKDCIKIIRKEIAYLKEDNRYRTNPIFILKYFILNRVKNKDEDANFYKYFIYNFEELKTHLENQFESWMSWENFAAYDYKTWKENDVSTWTWTITHIDNNNKDDFDQYWKVDSIFPNSSKYDALGIDKKEIEAKAVLFENQKNRVKELFDNGKGSRKIAEEMDVSREFVRSIYKILDLDTDNKYIPRTAYLATEKHCSGECKKIKPISEFRKRYDKKTDRTSYEPYCNDCARKISNKRSKEKAKLLRKTNPEYRLKKNVSYSIWSMLTKNGSSKKGQSSSKYLPYNFNQLKEHIEAQFEPWMNWKNYGVFTPSTWNDDDQNTWTWQLDHIIPHSDLPYSSMTDDNFKKCWSLNNLRPYSAKQNMIDGVKRIRHNK